jgi:AmmeMemoRadiSam system protein B
VFVLGPNHRVPLQGFALPSAHLWRTPLGDIHLARDVCEELLLRDDVVVSELAHAEEHSLEVELPFLQLLFPEGLRIVPRLVGQVRPEAVCEILAAFWEREDISFVLSSDLSHFLDEESARERDADTLRRLVEAKRPDLAPEDACGYSGLNGLILWTQEKGLLPRILAAKNSGDAGAGRERVVGYGALGLWQPPSAASHQRGRPYQ